MITRALTVAALVAAAVAVPAAHAVPESFHDNFDHAVDADPTYGLNDSLNQRQKSGAVTYGRVSGRWHTGDAPRPWFAQVNHPRYPGKLSLHLGPTAVRLDAPSTGKTISATLTPVAGGATSGDWSSILLSQSANSWGYVSNQDIDLGFLVRANGGVQVFRAGELLVSLPAFATARADGSFDVQLTLDGSALQLTVNGTDKSVELGTAVPTDRLWVYLGRYSDDEKTVSLVDDLRIEALNSDDLRKGPEEKLRYYGYFAARITQSGGDHLPEVRGRSNLNWVQISDADGYRPEVLEHCAEASCLVYTGNEFFDCHSGPNCVLYPDAEERWRRLADQVRPHLGRVAGFVLLDEPFHRGASFADVQRSAQVVKNTFDRKVMLIEAAPKIDDAFRVPSEVDWVGFDEYCADYAGLETRMAKLVERAPGKELFVMPPGAKQCTGQDDATLESLQYMYLALARQYPQYVGMLVFGPWTGVGPDAPGPGTPVPAKYPRATDAQERVAALVLGEARLER